MNFGGLKNVLTAAMLAVGSAGMAGCSHPTVAEQDARDRESPAIRKGLDREQVGDLDGAIRAYEEALLDSPRLASAQLHLALLLQDYRKDYMSAIYHYHQYELLRPDTEKKALIRDRTRICEQLLLAQMLSRGDVAISREQQRLVAENEKLNQRLSQVEGEKAALLDQKNGLEKQLSEQKLETERQRRLAERLQLPGETDESREHSVLPRLDTSGGTPTPPMTAPPSPGHLTTGPDITSSLLPRHESRPEAHPADPPGPADTHAAPRTYVVQPGDSLFAIAEHVYGDPMQWKKVRDANRDRIGAEGRLRVGQVLTIP